MTSAQLVLTKSQPSLDRLPEDILANIFGYLDGYLDDKTILLTALVCKTLQTSIQSTEVWLQASTRLRHRSYLTKLNNEFEESLYPQNLTQLFQRCYLPIRQLPKFKDSIPTGVSGEARLPLHSRMTHPIMRYTDSFGCPEIYLHLKERSGPVSGVLKVVALTDQVAEWSVALDRELRNSSDYLGLSLNLSFGDPLLDQILSDLLQDRNRCFRIAQNSLHEPKTPIQEQKES